MYLDGVDKKKFNSFTPFCLSTADGLSQDFYVELRLLILSLKNLERWDMYSHGERGLRMGEWNNCPL